MPKNTDLPICIFDTQQNWYEWLAKNHDTSKGIWMRVFKKDSGIKTITIAEALDGALCYGWIDGQRNAYDEQSYLQRYTPRRPRSIWSKRNTEHIVRLTKLGKMQPAGLKEVERAKADGRWEQAYASPKNMIMPEDFLKELHKDKKAREFFETLNKTNSYAIAWHIQTAKKPETRARRMKRLLEMLQAGKKLY